VTAVLDDDILSVPQATETQSEIHINVHTLLMPKATETLSEIHIDVRNVCVSE